MAFVIYLWSNLLISLYHNSGKNAPQTPSHEESARRDPTLWQLLVSGATGHHGNGSIEPKLDDYAALPNSARTEDSIELGNRAGGYASAGRNIASHPNAGRAMFDADLEARESDDDDDGGDAYWEQHDLHDESSKVIRAR